MAQQINIDITPTGESYEIVRCSQSDVGRAFQINLMDGNNAYHIPTGAELIIAGKKNDKYVFEYTDNITQDSRTTVTITLKEQMTACPGPVMCELRIKTSTGIIGTCNFVLLVEGGVLDGIVSTSEIAIIAQVEQDIAAAEAAAASAAQSASDAASSASAAAGSASDASRSATAAALSATAADTSAHNAASSETNAAASATAADGSAQAAAQSAQAAAQSAQGAASNAQNAALSATNAAADARAAAGGARAAAEAAAEAAALLEVTETIVEILASDWNSSTHLATVTVQGVTATSTQEIAPLIANDSTNITNNEALANAQLYDAGQGTNFITLYAVNVPTEKVKVRVLQRGVNANA